MDLTLTIDSASGSTSSSSLSDSSTETSVDLPKEKKPVILETEYVQEKPEPVDFDVSFTPFSLHWCYGRNMHVPFLNLTSEERKIIFYSASHVGVLYDYENKIMRFLQGHKNCITSIASDSKGKWIVTADAGEDNVIIVWNSENCLPTCTIFDAHCKDGTILVGISPDSKYLVSVSAAKDPVIACWRWTFGEKEPAGEYLLEAQAHEYGKIQSIVFSEETPEYFVVTADFWVLFGTWENDKLSVHIQERNKNLGKLNCSVYQNFSHYALTGTDEGYLLMWSSVSFSSVYNCNVPQNNKKKLLRTLKLSKESIQVIKTNKEIVVTGSVFGELRFYDKMIRILYWVQSFQLSSITAINFHMWYSTGDQPIKEKSCDVSDRMDPFKPFAALERAFERVLEKEKEKLADLKLILKNEVKPAKEIEDVPHNESLIDETIENVLKVAEQWEVDDATDKRQFIDKLIKTTLDQVENKLTSAVAHTQELIEGFLDSVLKEVETEDIPKHHAKDIASLVVGEIMETFDSGTTVEKGDIIIREILEKITDSICVIDDIMDEAENIQEENPCTLTQLVVGHVFQKIEDKFSIDMKKVVDFLVRNLVKDFEEKYEEILTDVEHGKAPKLYCHLQKIINQNVEEMDPLQVPSDASLDRKPFLIGDFMISTVDGDIRLVNFLKNSYTIVHDKCTSPITSLDCNLGKQQFAVGNVSGSITLYNFLETQSKVLETFVRPSESQCGVTALKFAPSGFYLACGWADGTLCILDSAILTSLLKINHCHTDAPISQIAISDDSMWIAHRDTGMRVCLYKYDDPSGCDIEFMGKQKSHFKPIQDLMFMRSLEKQLHLFSLGEDRMLIEYDLVHSEPDDLQILFVERIEQSAIPYCMTTYTKLGAENFILIANSEYKFKIFNSDTRMCRKTALGPRFEKPLSKFIILPKASEKSNQYMIYACEKHIGIQMLPLDGNPYKSVGMIGHPVKITNMDIYPHSKTLFTVGQDDHAIFMWTIHTRAVDLMVQIGGDGLNPYFCLIDGGQDGRLYKEIQDFFYYAQILHEGKNTTSKRSVSHEIPLCEVPDLMRAIGYFPSEHEIENMLHEIQYWSYSDNSKPQKYISFEDFVKLYVNHKPAFGIPYSKLKESFEVFADTYDDDDDNEENPIMQRETLINMLQERAECLPQEHVIKYLQILFPSREPSISSSSDSTSYSSTDSIWNFIPQVIPYKTFVAEILGLTSSDEELSLLQSKDKIEAKTQYEKNIRESSPNNKKEEENHTNDKREVEEIDKTDEEDKCVDDFD